MGNEKRIMVIDDEQIVGKRLKPALEKLDVIVETFDDPKQAMKRFKEEHFHVVVTDIRMEQMDGMQVLEEVLRINQHTKVIVITGYATVELAREVLARGAFDFIAKPFKPSDLRKILDQALQQTPVS